MNVCLFVSAFFWALHPPSLLRSSSAPAKSTSGRWSECFNSRTNCRQLRSDHFAQRNATNTERCRWSVFVGVGVSACVCVCVCLCVCESVCVRESERNKHKQQATSNKQQAITHARMHALAAALLSRRQQRADQARTKCGSTRSESAHCRGNSSSQNRATMKQ